MINRILWIGAIVILVAVTIGMLLTAHYNEFFQHQDSDEEVVDLCADVIKSENDAPLHEESLKRIESIKQRLRKESVNYHSRSRWTP